jgi:signal transduction histidine kinase
MKLETARLHRDLKETNRKLSIKAAELSEAVRARDVFLATASHELKTPLSTLALQVELIRRSVDSLPPEVDDAIGDNLGAVERQVGRLSRLISQLLDVSRLSEGQLRLDVEAVDLVEVAREVVSRFDLKARRNDVSIEFHGDECPGVWDPSRLDQLISNLVSNAVKYGGSRVRVDVGCRGSDATLQVCDDGDGIPEEERRRIFERFERAEGVGAVQGLGLGLWIVKQIVERFDGDIEVADGIDGGTCFLVTLPRNAGPVASPE